MTPSWFSELAGMLEPLGLDSPRDRNRLWEIIHDNIPRKRLREAFGDVLCAAFVRDQGLTREEAEEFSRRLESALVKAMDGVLDG